MRNFDQRHPRVNVSHFSMVPRSDVPRSVFHTQHCHKTTFQSGLLIPVHVDEVLPGDVHRGTMHVFARLATPIFPIMDNVYIESFFFFVPCRLLWTNWVKMMGEQVNPADSIAFTIPYGNVGAITAYTLYDYMGIPPTGQMVNTFRVNILPFRAYYQIWNEWFRDENLQNSLVENVDDGPDAGSYLVQSRGKRHDYFTSCLPWPQKGGAVVNALVGSATVKTNAVELVTGTGPVNSLWRRVDTGAAPPNNQVGFAAGTGALNVNATAFAGSVAALYPSNLYADLSTATGNTINSLRLAVTVQQLLEKDARGGTRYTELLRNHFGVLPEDFRLQRPEYIGGGKTMIQTSAVPVTSSLAQGATPQAPTGGLAAAGTAGGSHSFSYHAKEHGYILGLVHCGADLTYQQGVHRLYTRRTRYDFYWPVFANLGEQVVYNHEIYAIGNNLSLFPTDPSIQDGQTFGYQERWAEYRHRPSRISGAFRSTTATPIDAWHLAQKFTALPTLGATFITDNPPMSRVLAASTAADNQQVLFDSYFDIKCTRPMPQFSVPGLRRF